MTNGEILDICGDASLPTNSVIIPVSQGSLSITAVPSQLLLVCTQNTQTGGGGSLGSTSYVNSNPYFYDLENNQGNTKQSSAAIAAGTYEILFGELYDGENTSSLSLLTGTQPAGDTVTPDIIFPKGNYIFTMSDFDTGRFSNGRTEFGLWTSYGDYANYIFENQLGSGQNPVTIDYINTSYNQDTVDVYNLAATDFQGTMTPSSQNGGAQNVGTAMAFSGNGGSGGTKYQRINIEVSGVYNIGCARFSNYGQLRLYIQSDQTTTGVPTSTLDGLPVYQMAIGTVEDITTLTLTAGQQLVLSISSGPGLGFAFDTIYNTSLDSNVIQAALGSPTAQTPFNEPFVITGSIGNNYIGGTTVPAGFATKITDAYIVYSSSATSSLAGSYIFDVTPTYGLIALTASVLVKSFSGTSTSALYGSANYGTEDYGGGFATGGTTWTTASLIIYSGSANSFPNLMPELGGDIFFRKDSYSTNHASGTRITIEENILPAQLEYNTVLKMALLVSSGSSAPSVVQSSLIVTEYSMSFSSSIDTDIDPSIPTVFSDDSNFDLALDCQPLLNNYSDGRLNDRLQDIDYNFGTVTPSNWQQIIEFSASKASVPESNYTIRASANPRYFGTRTDSARINAWTPGDIGGYGKLPNVEISRGFLGYFKSTTDLYPLLNNSTQYNIQYLIGQDGVATQPKLSDISLYNMQGTFDSYPEVSKGVVALNQKSDSEVLTSLDGTIIFKKVTQRPVPIIYTQKSNLFPLSSSYDGGGVYEGEGLDMIGSEPVDASITPTFANFGFLAESLDAGSEGTTFTDTFNATQKTPISNTTPNITSSFADNSTTYQVYDTSTGTIRIPNTDGYPDTAASGNGKSTSQDYDLDFSIGIDTTPLTYVVQTSNPNKGGNFNSSPNVGSFNIKPQRTNNQGPTSTAFNTFIPSSVNVIVTNFYLQADGTELTTTINYRQVASSLVNITGAGITVTFNSNVIKNAISNTGQPSTAVQEGGNLLKQRWTVSGQLTGTSIKQGRNFRFTGTGNMIVLTATGRDILKDPKFFPTQQSGKIETRISLDGAESNPVTAAIPPYWIFKDTVGDGTGTKIANTLMMSSSQMNKAYGRGFIQKDLIYTSSLNKDFPDGIEPSFATFPTIQTPWDIQPYDEIRFRGNEDYNYVVTSVRTPAQQLTASYVQDGIGMLEVTLDRDIPLSFDNITTATPGGIGVALDVKATSSLYSGSDEGTIIPVFKKVNYSIQTFRPLDFFLVRRYVEDASSLITFQQYPYGNPPVSQSVSGFISPEYPTAQLKTNPDDILSDLIDKKLIE
jgi:hypothetical protein